MALKRTLEHSENIDNMMPAFKNIPVRLRAFIKTPRGWLALLVLFHLCANIWWLALDNHAIITDEETHMIMARDYYNALFPRVGDRSIGARLAALGRIKADVGNPVHPPLLHIAGALSARLLGYGVDRMAFVNTLAFLAAIVGVYLLLRRFLDDKEAFFAALVFSLTPMIYASSRYFMTDFLSMAVVVWVMYALIKSERFSSLRWSALFGLLNGIALMTRTTAVIYYLVPGFVVFCGAFIMLFERHEGGWRFNQMGLAKLVLNGLLIVFITLAVCSPWYITHGAQFYTHWMKPQKGGAGAPISFLTYDKPDVSDNATAKPDKKAVEKREAEEAEEKPVSEEKEQESASSPEKQASGKISSAVATDTGGWRLLPRRKIGWIRYPVFIINNAVFLPMFTLALVGIFLVPVCSRFRGRFAAWMLLCWLLGSYVLLTILLTFATPRYAMQALPALAILSVLPVLMLPGKRLRVGAMALYIALLVFQYGNLTVHAYGPVAEAKVPVILDEKYQKIYDDPGLYFFKPVLHASSAYGCMQAPVKENAKDRLFFSMLKAEQERPFYGIEGNYARLNIRGMILYEEHFWLDGNSRNPFRRKDIPPELTPYRNLRHYGWSKDIENILPLLGLVDYVVYTTEDITPETEQAWLHTLEKQGFEPIDRFFEPRFGMVPARYFGLLARKPGKPLPRPASQNDVWGLNLQQLYQVRHSAVFRSLTPELQESVSSRLQASFRETGKTRRLSDDVDFRGFYVDQGAEGQYSIKIILYTRNAVSRNYRMLFRGIVEPKYMAAYFNSKKDQAGEFRWRFEPTPSPKSWPENDFVILQFPVVVPPIPYHMSFVFFTQDDGPWGDSIDLGVIDFGKIASAQE